MGIMSEGTYCATCHLPLCLRCQQCHALDCQAAVISCLTEDSRVPPLLIDHLSASVLLEMWHLARWNGPSEEQIEAARGLVERQALNESIMYPVPRETRIGVAQLSELLAILAYQPGGVQFGVLHFEAKRDNIERNDVMDIMSSVHVLEQEETNHGSIQKKA